MTIKEVAEITGISADTLRYYERIGIIPHVQRTASGLRDYNDTNIHWIEFAKCFKKAGIQLEGIIEYMNLAMLGKETENARRAILEETKETIALQIEELGECLKSVQFKLDNYYNICLPQTDQLIDAWKKEQNAREERK